jgi:uncharacterized protein YegJ (DUF2314 family)
MHLYSSRLFLTQSFLALAFVFATPTTRASEFDDLSKQGERNFATPEGRRYQLGPFEKAFLPRFVKALGKCSQHTPDTKMPATLVFVIAGDGKIKRVLHTPGIPLGECLAAELQSLRTVAPPPHDAWVVAFAAANHFAEERAKGPPDTPRRMDTEAKMAAYDKAIAPYIAKARATYPAAKQRFLAGLPSGHRFSVRVPLFDRSGNKREDTFVNVEKIKNGNITGTITNEMGVVKEYKIGQRITFSENKIDNWLILRPDGTEEGNYVGKFLDHYKPK